MGGAGAIAAAGHVGSADFVRMIDDGLAGRVADTDARAAALRPVALTLFADPNMAVIKGVEPAQGRILTPDVRLPMTNASKTAVDGALAAMDGGGPDSGPCLRAEPRTA
jgi:4-hydroxy-tetrahydrodipicolinate synthase